MGKVTPSHGLCAITRSRTADLNTALMVLKTVLAVDGAIRNPVAQAWTSLGLIAAMGREPNTG